MTIKHNMEEQRPAKARVWRDMLEYGETLET